MTSRAIAVTTNPMGLALRAAFSPSVASVVPLIQPMTEVRMEKPAYAATATPTPMARACISSLCCLIQVTEPPMASASHPIRPVMAGLT